jgi:hypothetical protein
MTEEFDYLTHLYQYPELLLFFAAVTAGVVAVIPFLRNFFDRFFTTLHELGHAIATRFTKGEVESVEVTGPDSGVTTTRGGDLFTIFPAGYVGVPVFTALTILLGSSSAWAPIGLGIIGGFLLLIFVLFSPGANVFYTAWSWVLPAIAFIGVAWMLHPVWSVFVMNFLAVYGTLDFFHSFSVLSRATRERSGGSDPEKMAGYFGKTPFLNSPWFWVWSWWLISIVLLIGAYWFAWFGRNMLFT